MSLFKRAIRRAGIILKRIFRVEIRLLKRGRGYQINRFSYQKEYIDFGIKKDDRVLDIGSGSDPFPLATHLADFYEGRTTHRVGELVKDERPFLKCSIENTPFKNKEFDFVYCSHVLEHVDSPAKACEELMRIAKRGYIETPTRLLDTMANITSMKNHHKWFVEELKNTLIFMEFNENKQRDVKTSYFFDQFQSEWKNPFQDLVKNNQDLFSNMFLWKDRFYYYVFDKKGSLISTNQK